MRLETSRELTDSLFNAQTANRLSELSIPANAAEQRELFLSDQIENPQFIYSALMSANQTLKIRATVEYKRRLEAAKLSPHERGMYTYYADSLDHQIELFQAAQDHAKASASSGNTHATTERFLDLRTSDFGELPLERYKQSVRYVLEKFKSLDETEAQIYWSYIDVRTGHSAADSTFSFMTPESTDRVKAALESLGLIPDKGVLPDQPLVTNVELKDAIQLDLTARLDADNWRAELADIQAPAQTDRIQSIVKVNQSLPPMTPEHAIEITAHENLHALRAMTAQAIGSTLLLAGLPGAEKAEEGLATLVGKVASDSLKSLENFDYPIFVAGLMEHEGYDFRTTFEILWRVLALLRLASTNPQFQENHIQASRAQAYQIVYSETRIFDRPRFSSLENMGGVIAMWDHLDTHADDPMALETLLIGKHDPTNEDHRRFVYNALYVGCANLRTSGDRCRIG